MSSSIRRKGPQSSHEQSEQDNISSNNLPQRSLRAVGFQSGLRSMESKHKQLNILRCKLVIVGDACVGKTALTQVFQSDGATFPKNYMMTAGVEFSIKQVPIPESNTIVELYLFDCAGQSIFNQAEMNAKHYENAQACMIVYDIGNHESLQSCSKWLSSVRKANILTGLVAGVMVGNKADYREDRTSDSRASVLTREAEGIARELDLKYFEASARSNAGVEDPFKHIATEFYKRFEDAAIKADNISSSGGRK